MNIPTFRQGFTVVELVIVITVIAILAAVSIVGYNGVQERAVTASLHSDLRQASDILQVERTYEKTFPATLPDEVVASSGNTFTYVRASSSEFCLSVQNDRMIDLQFQITQAAQIEEGACTVPVMPGPVTVTANACEEGGYTNVSASWSAPANSEVTSFHVESIDNYYGDELDPVTITNTLSSAGTFVLEWNAPNNTIPTDAGEITVFYNFANNTRSEGTSATVTPPSGPGCYD